MLKVTVEFEPCESSETQGTILLEMEKILRGWFVDSDVRVFKARMGDDSKLRMAMTPEERAQV